MTGRFATVRIRVTAGAVLVVAVALLVGGFVLVVTYRNSLTHDVETATRLRSRDLADAIQTGALSSNLADSGGDDSLAQVVDQSGSVIASSPNIEGAPPISRLRPDGHDVESKKVQQLPVGDAPFRIVARRVTTTDGDVFVYVARSLEPVEDNTNHLARLLLFGFPVLLAVVGATMWIVTGRALRPVDAIRDEVDSIGADDLYRRVPEPGTNDEVGRLARTMNTMLARLQDASDRQRRFVADASHELRSPLTGIRAQLEVDLAHPELADWQATERDVLEDAIRLQRLVDDLLVLASSQAAGDGAEHREPVDLDEIVLREARRLASRSVHAVDTRAVSGAQLMGNAHELTRAVRNLLDNADRHAASRVTLSLQESDDEITVVVADDGPGIPAEQQARIFERFTRLDDARARDNGGTGLGLAITHAVVTAHGGTISVENRPGAEFTVRIPLRGSTD